MPTYLQLVQQVRQALPERAQRRAGEAIAALLATTVRAAHLGAA